MFIWLKFIKKYKIPGKKSGKFDFIVFTPKLKIIWQPSLFLKPYL